MFSRWRVDIDNNSFSGISNDDIVVSQGRKFFYNLHMDRSSDFISENLKEDIFEC